MSRNIEMIANLQVIAQIRNEEYNREERNDNENPSQAPNVNLNELPFMRFNFNRIYLTQHEEIRLRYNFIVMNMKRMLEIQSVYLVFILALCIQCSITQLWKFQYPLLILICYYLFNIRRNIRDYKRSQKQGDPYLDTIERLRYRNNEEIDRNLLIRHRRKTLIISIIEDANLIFASLLLMLYASRLFHFPSYVCVIPLAIAVASKFAWQKLLKSPFESSVHYLALCISICRLIILTFVLLKLDGVVNWTWGIVLCGYWTLFVVMLIISLFCFILFLNSVYSVIHNETRYHSMIGSYWMFWFCGGFTSSTFICAFNCVSMFDINDGSNSNFSIFIQIFCPLIVYFILLILKTLICWRPLISWWDFFLYSNEHFDFEPEIEIEPSVENANNRERNIRTVEVKSPLFLKRISDTLFAKTKYNGRRWKQNKIEAEEEKKSCRSVAKSFNNSNNRRKLEERKFSEISSNKKDLKSNNSEKMLFIRNDCHKQVNPYSNHNALEIPKYSKFRENRKYAKANMSFSNQKKEESYNFPNYDGTMSEVLEKVYRRNMEIMNMLKEKYEIDIDDKFDEESCIENSKGDEISEELYSIKSTNKVCNICCDRFPDAVIMDCGHGGVCYLCACIFIKIDERCYFCRNPVSSILQISISSINSKYLKIISVSVIDREEGIENIERIMMNLNNRNTENEDDFSVNRNDLNQENIAISKKDKSSSRNQIKPINFNQINNHMFLHPDQIVSEVNFAHSHISSCKRLDRVDELNNEGNLNSVKERKLLSQNVANLDVYLPSNKINKKSLQPTNLNSLRKNNSNMRDSYSPCLNHQNVQKQGDKILINNKDVNRFDCADEELK